MAKTYILEPTQFEFSYNTNSSRLLYYIKPLNQYEYEQISVRNRTHYVRKIQQGLSDRNNQSSEFVYRQRAM